MAGNGHAEVQVLWHDECGGRAGFDEIGHLRSDHQHAGLLQHGPASANGGEQALPEEPVDPGLEAAIGRPAHENQFRPTLDLCDYIAILPVAIELLVQNDV